MGRVHLGLSTPTFVDTIDEFLERTARDGWDFAEFNHLDLPPFSPELLDTGERARVKDLAADLGLEISLHAGDCDLLTLDPGFLRYSEDRILTEAELARDLGAVYLNTHLGFPERMVRPGKSLWADEHFDFQRRVAEAVRHVARVADATGVRILYENTYRLIEPLMEAINECSSPNVGFLLDVGHANIAGGVRELHSTMSRKGKLFALHLHDNDGRWDQHAPLGSGTLDLEGIELPPYVAVEVRNWDMALGTREEFRKRYL
ncbi:MAG: TIM barrel protein [Thermoplasmata archaeon]|nr:sugar phosphate isomerase/epimerase [Thermoplasmata archaeon]NIS12787.1 sugar phosphate isomerase/epimerase [Thermoplasmata archaeon]NIS19549.1 sugar phosphate isomerase/epimerase [Thermoplasmata archaeon]NIV78315.1 TIM barrel protein [Thermoplasmata archaeon]NIW82153.1 TIM barrel protein [Thermoplasmata archaeon]